MASIEVTKETVQRGFEVLNERDREAFVDLHTDDAVLHGFGQEFRGIEEIAANQFAFLEAFPDATLTPGEMIAEGETVAARWTVTGTHENEFQGIEPTGESIELSVIGMFQVEDEQVAEVWLSVDQLELMQQLGVVDAPGE